MQKKAASLQKKKAFSILKNKKITDKLFTIIAKRYESRKGGYVKILKNGFRYGDMAPLAVIELVDRDEKAKGLDSGPVQKKKVDNIDNNEKETATDQELKKNEKDQKVPEKELKENEEIAKKLEKKKDK